jgi:hypothetical protein
MPGSSDRLGHRRIYLPSCLCRVLPFAILPHGSNYDTDLIMKEEDAERRCSKSRSPELGGLVFSLSIARGSDIDYFNNGIPGDYALIGYRTQRC